MKPSAVVLLGLLVVLAGCSQLAGPVDGPATTAGPVEGTVAAPSDASQSVPTTARETGTTNHASTHDGDRHRDRDANPNRDRDTDIDSDPDGDLDRTATATRTATSTMARPTTVPPATRTTRTTTGSGSAALSLASVDAANETVVLRNTGQRRLDLDGYVVDFDDGQRYALPPYTLGPKTNVTIHTGRGDDSRGDLYAGFFYAVINDGGDTVLVENPNGRIVAAERVAGGNGTIAFDVDCRPCGFMPVVLRISYD